MTDHVNPQDQQHRYAYIDALRGWAIMGVVMVHCSIVARPDSEFLLWFMQQGAKGVQLFFIVSALTLANSWKARQGHEPHAIRNFFIRRFFRIAPMFYLAILGYLLLNGLSATYWAPNGIEWWAIVLTVVFAHGIHPESINAVVPGSWSIAAEMTFYLLFVPFMQVIRSTRSTFFLILASLILYKLNELWTTDFFSYPDQKRYIVTAFTELNFASQLPFFALGLACFFCMKAPGKSSLGPGVAIISGFMLLAVICTSRPSPLLAGGAFSASLLLLNLFPSSLMVNPLTVALGKSSYSIYLIHFPVLALMQKAGWSEVFRTGNASSMLLFFTILTFSFKLAWLTRRFIEAPGISLGEWIINRLKPA